MEILDSGNRQAFESGAVRDIQEGKGRCDLLPMGVVSTSMLGLFGLAGTDATLFFDKIKEFIATGEHVNLSVAFKLAVQQFYCAGGKGNYSEGLCTAWLEVAIHLEEGAKKYGERNWEKGIPVSRYIDSAVRHYLKALRGDIDEPHKRAVLWNLMAAIHTCMVMPELNDYAPKNKDEDDATIA